MQTILTLDAGFVNTGWAVIDPQEHILFADVIRTERIAKKQAVRVADDDTQRTQSIFRHLCQVVDAYNVAGIVAELPTGGAKGARAIACMARASSIVGCLAERYGLPLEIVTPQAVKQVAGKRSASKEEVEAALCKQWPDATRMLPLSKGLREHVADALAAYLAARNGNMVRGFVRGAA